MINTTPRAPELKARPWVKPLCHDVGGHDAAKSKGALIGTPLSESVRQTQKIGKILLDESVEPARSRLRAMGTDTDVDSDEIIAMGQIYVAEHGGSIRTFNGGLHHECGWWPGYKRRRLQHWQGMAQRAYLLRHECDVGTLWAQSEARRFVFPHADRRRSYTCDAELRLIDGTIVIVEIKRTPNDLSDEDYRLTLAGVAEICRRIGWEFRIVFADEIFANRHHRNNVELFASRRFATVTPTSIRRLEAFATKVSQVTTYGHLAEVLRPDWAVAGKAIIQALLVRRRIDIDLTQPLDDSTRVDIL